MPISPTRRLPPPTERFSIALGSAALALLLTLAGCGDPPPRELTEAERICKRGPSIECAQARQLEKQWERRAKELQDAGLIR